MAAPLPATPVRAGRPVDDPVYVALLEAMIAARKDRAVRQSQLAAVLGQPQSYVSKIESRERRIDVGEYVAWMRALGVDPLELLARVLSA